MVYLGERPIAGFGTVQQLNYTDAPVEGQYVTSVSQTNGIISVTRQSISTEVEEAVTEVEASVKAYVDEAMTWGSMSSS